jgi:hypothetical protein
MENRFRCKRIEVPFELRLEKIGCGRRNRTFIFGFKARRIAGYTIPQTTDTETGRRGDREKSDAASFRVSVSHHLRVSSWSGHWDSNPEPRADLALKPLIRRLLFQLSYAP